MRRQTWFATMHPTSAMVSGVSHADSLIAVGVKTLVCRVCCLTGQAQASEPVALLLPLSMAVAMAAVVEAVVAGCRLVKH